MRIRRRILGVVLVALSVLTLAPRTSDQLENGWNVVVAADTSLRAQGPVSTVTFWALPPAPVPGTSLITVRVSGTDWTLVAAPPNCTRSAGEVVCVFNREAVRRKHLVTLTVRSSGPVSYTFVGPPAE